MAHVAVVLSGCGHRDGAEIREAAYAMLALDQEGATFDCFAPDKAQADVVNHLTGDVMPGETRNVLVESARIARGNVAPLASFDAGKYDALVFPGGFGGAKNLSDFASKGAQGTPDPDVGRAVAAMQAAQKPVGFICITPASVGALCLGKTGATLTIGDDEGTAAAIEATGARHQVCSVGEAVTDRANRVASTPAYMDDAARPSQVYDGIRAMVKDVLGMVDELVTA